MGMASDNWHGSYDALLEGPPPPGMSQGAVRGASETSTTQPRIVQPSLPSLAASLTGAATGEPSSGEASISVARNCFGTSTCRSEEANGAASPELELGRWAAASSQRLDMRSRSFHTSLHSREPQLSPSKAPAKKAADFFGTKQKYPQPQNRPADPWTPTQQLRKRKTLPKRMGFMIQTLEKEQVEQIQRRTKARLPKFDAGDLLELTLAVPENQGKTSTFKGICIARRERSLRTSFTLRNYIGSVGGVERTFPLYSPIIQSIRVIGSRKVRRAKLYYLRNRNPKESRVN